MNMPVRNTEVAMEVRPSAAKVVALAMPKRGTLASRTIERARDTAAQVLPPLIVLGIILGVWQILCMKPGATLPSPSKIWVEAYDLIVDPFFVAGPQDIGLGWRVLTSLQRVAVGYGLAGVIGILIGGLLAWLINTFSPFPAVIQTSWVIIAFGVSVLVGLTFGLWPALKAARLDPIEALRYE